MSVARLPAPQRTRPYPPWSFLGTDSLFDCIRQFSRSILAIYFGPLDPVTFGNRQKLQEDRHHPWPFFQKQSIVSAV